MGDNEPAWLKNNGSASSAGPVAASGTADATSSGKEPPYKKTVTGVFMVVNLGLMVFMAATGALGIQESNSVTDTGLVFVAIYLILFAGIEFIFELTQICPGNYLDLVMKKNFGFLYGNFGKGLYFMFDGILCFGLTEPRNLAIACGILVAAWGAVSMFCAMKFPDYFEPKEKFIP